MRAPFVFALTALVAFAAVACRDEPVMLEPSSSPDAGVPALAPEAGSASSAAPGTTRGATTSMPAAGALPAVRGAKAGKVDMVSWFAARQVDRAQLAAFLAAHGGGQVDGAACQAASVGSPPEAALVCLEPLVDTSSDQLHDRVQILVVRNAAPAIASGLFVAYYPRSGARFVDLAMTLAPDGLSFTIGDGGAGCDKARDQAADASVEIAHGVAKLCAERGVWSWQNGHFRRPRS